MLIELGLFVSLVKHANPAFRVNYEVEMVSLSPNAEPAVYQHVTERLETDSAGMAQRAVFKVDARTAILTYANHAVTIETIEPDGSMQSTKKPLPKGQSLDGLAGVLGLDLKTTSNVDTKETKRIHGVLCRKSIMESTLGDASYESIAWSPIESKYAGWKLPPFETYTYEVEGDTKSLVNATTLVSFKLGKLKPVTVKD